MPKTLFDQMSAGSMAALGAVLGILKPGATFAATLRSIPALPDGALIEEAARAYLFARLARIAPAVKHPDGVQAKAALIVQWLDYQFDRLSFGLRSVADAERLYDYWQAHGDTLPEYADRYDEDGGDLAPHRIAALGYDPLAAP